MFSYVKWYKWHSWNQSHNKSNNNHCYLLLFDFDFFFCMQWFYWHIANWLTSSMLLTFVLFDWNWIRNFEIFFQGFPVQSNYSSLNVIFFFFHRNRNHGKNWILNINVKKICNQISIFNQDFFIAFKENITF